MSTDKSPGRGGRKITSKRSRKYLDKVAANSILPSQRRSAAAAKGVQTRRKSTKVKSRARR